MKKIYSLILLLGSVFATTQAQVDFTFNGKVVQPGETLTFHAVDEGYGIIAYDHGFQVTNSGSTDANITVVVRKKEPADAQIQWCGITIQCGFIPGRSETRNATLAAGASADMRVDGWFTAGEYGTHKVTTTLTVNGESKTVNLHFVYDDPSGIASPVAEALKFAHNTISYSFDTQAARVLNVYNTAGALVKSFAIGQSGTASLAGLSAGVYVASVTANGQKVATRKCIVR